MLHNALGPLATENTLEAARALLAQLVEVLGVEGTPASTGSTGLLVLAQRHDDDGALVDDGDFATLKLNGRGRLKVSSQPAVYEDVVGTITNIQPNANIPVEGGTVEAAVTNASNVMMFCMGVFSAANCAFEGSLDITGDDNWFAIQAVRSNANTVETTTGSLSAKPGYAWELSVNGLARVRVRCTAATSGSQTWRFKLGSYATEPIPAIQPNSVSGTVTANIGVMGSSRYVDTTTPLSAGASYTGTARNAGSTPQYQRFVAHVLASHPGTLYLEEGSTTSSAYTPVRIVPVEANVPLEVEMLTVLQYQRVRYVNGGTAQTSFSLSSAMLKV